MGLKPEQQQQQKERERKEAEKKQETKEDDVRQGVGPLGLFPGDKVRLKNLKSDTTMNGLIGSFTKLDHVDGEDRYTIELDSETHREPVSARIHNIEKAEKPRTNKRKAPEPKGKAKAEPAPKKAAPKAAAPTKRITGKAKAKASPKKAASAPKQERTRARVPAGQPAKTPTKPRRGRDNDEDDTFNEQNYRVCAHPCVEVKDAIAGNWRPVHIFESRVDGRIVIAYGNNEFEGLPPSKPYRIEGVAPGASGIFWSGKGGRLVDADGECIETRQRPKD